jgi:hypothetical protein
MGIQYVLLIGDPNPYESPYGEGDIPMKTCHPEMNQTAYSECVPTPTDSFYADLTGNWDIDGDGYYGEWLNDYPVSGGVDFAPEVYVGRIPVYAANYAVLDGILQKIIDYENDSSTSWRKSALLPMSFLDSGWDTARLGEQMKADYLDAAGYSVWRMYQQGSGACGVDSVYYSEAELRGGAVLTQWANNDYGIVCWNGHGSSVSAAIGYSGCYDGTLLYSGDCTSLDDNHPAFVYQGSCVNGQPEWFKPYGSVDNLQFSLLQHGSIGAVAATRVSWYTYESNFAGSPSLAGIGYEFMDRLVSGSSAGQSLCLTRASITPSHQCWLMNFYDFNLLGDPSTGLTSSASLQVSTSNASNIGPSSATLNGSLDSMGLASSVEVSFIWGIDDGGPYPNETTASTMTDPGSFNFNLEDLHPTGETYYYKAKADGGTEGIVYGEQKSFTTHDPPERLIGSDTVCASSVSANYARYAKFTALEDGVVREIRVYARAGGNIKVAMYADNGSGHPVSRLNYIDSSQSVTGGQWNTIVFPDTEVEAGTTYWLGVANDAAGVVAYNATGGNGFCYQGISFDTFSWPATAQWSGSGSSYNISVAGWGN